MDKDDTIWVVISLCSALLFIVSVILAIVFINRFCCRRAQAPRVSQSAEDQNNAVPMTPIVQSGNNSDHRQAEQEQNIAHNMPEQVFQIYIESPRPEPSAPPLPPEYFMDYT